MKRRGHEILWGLLFLLGAVFIVINKMGFLQGVGIFSILCSIVAAGILIKSLIHRSFGGILFSLAFLCILYDKPLGIEELTPWPVLATALLGTIGLNMLFRKKHSWCYSINATEYREIVDEESDGQVRCETAFSSTTKYINSSSFKSAVLESSFGSMSVYFDNAVLEDGRAQVRVETSFGHMELYIPKTWKVVLDVESAFGGIKEHGRCDSTNDENVLLISGEASFGGIDIYYI